MPIGLVTNSSAGVSDGTIGTVESRSGRIGEPGVVVTSTVRSSMASVANSMSPKYLTPTSQPNSGTLMRSRVKAMSAASSVVPSWKVTPSRSLMRQVSSSTWVHSVASRGFSVLVPGSNSVSVSLTFCRMTRPTSERAAMQGSTTSSSSFRTMRTVRSSWASAAVPERRAADRVSFQVRDCFTFSSVARQIAAALASGSVPDDLLATDNPHTNILEHQKEECFLPFLKFG